MLTVYDTQELLLNFLDQQGKAANVIAVRQAIQEALRTLANHHHWSYYKRDGRVVTSAPYETGTITYDHTGGTYERELTLASGTWPTWAHNGVVVIDTEGYFVHERISDTVVTLESETNPGSDVAAGTSYKIYRKTYDFPVGHMSFANLALSNQTGDLCHVSAKEMHFRWSRQQENTGQPWIAAVRADGNTPGRIVIDLYPYPDARYEVHYAAVVRPKDPVTWEYSEGTLTSTADSTAITGSGTTWTTRMENAILRTSDKAAVEPTFLYGSNPYQWEAAIAKVASATSIRLFEGADSALSGVKYRISDPVDIEPGTMETAFMRCAEFQLAKIRRWPDAERHERRFLMDLKVAKNADFRWHDRRSAVPSFMGGLPLRDMPTSDDVE